MSTITMTECTVPHFDELHFEEKGHTYTVNGQLYPSVSTLMRPLSEAHYEGIDMSVLAKAAERGTIVHNAIENFILFGIEDIDPQYEGYFLAFKKWWKEVNPVALGSECAVYHRVLQYAGTADLPVVIGGQKILVDVKTSANVNRMLTGIQLEAYDKMDKRIIEESCCTYWQLHRYAYHDALYGWHISDLKIYDKPKKIREFCFPEEKYCEHGLCGGCPYEEPLDEYGGVMFGCEWKRPLSRPPMSWCYVKEV